MLYKLFLHKPSTKYIFSSVRNIKTMRTKRTHNIQIIKTKNIKPYKNSINFIMNLVIFHLGFGIYGFTRGYRSKDIDIYKYDYETDKFAYKNRLIIHKFLYGCMSSIYYGIPIVNLIFVSNLLGRLEVYFLNTNIDDYSIIWYEFGGKCKDII